VKHSDILRAIWKIVAAIPIKVTFQEVKAHQDDHVRYDDLDRPSQLNVHADTEAK